MEATAESDQARGFRSGLSALLRVIRGGDFRMSGSSVPGAGITT
jgi:hypothetical protein